MSLTYMREDMEFPSDTRLLVHTRGIRTDVAEKLAELEDRLDALEKGRGLKVDDDDIEMKLSRIEEDIKNIKTVLNNVVQSLLDAADGLEEVE